MPTWAAIRPLLWDDGDSDFTRVEWTFGTVFPPAEMQWHQHFRDHERAVALRRYEYRRHAVSNVSASP